MSVATTRRIAAKIMKAGESRVRIRPDDVQKAAQALTADDVRALIREGVVFMLPVKGVPRIRARIKHAKKRAGRRGGAGSKKGTMFSRVSAKAQWQARVRAQRRELRELRDAKRLKDGTYRSAYLMVKGNAFRSVGAMLAHLKDVKWLKAEAVRGGSRAVIAEGDSMRASRPVGAEGAAKPAAPAAAAETKK